MENQKVQIHQERDFGQVMNASFAFLKQEFKPLFLSLIIFGAPLMVVLGIIYGFEISVIQNNMTEIRTTHDFTAMYSFAGIYIFLLIVMLFSTTAMQITVISYIKKYANTMESPSVSFIFGEIKKFLFPVIGANILAGIVIVAGSCLCGLPGIYIGVSLSVFISALIIEENGIGDAFSRSFKLTHLQWWWTFLTLFVAFIILYVLYIILEIPVFVAQLTAILHAFKHMDGNMATYSSPVIIYQSIVMPISFLLTTIPMVIMTFYYYSLTEKLEKTSLAKQIEEIGKNE